MPRSDLKDKAEMLTPPMPWDRPRLRSGDGPIVVLLHGLWRGFHAMEPMARSLTAAGFTTLNIPYPSTRLKIPRLAERIAQEINRCAKGKTVHFVTHSLGGILIRAILAQDHPWQTGRIVMLSPPHGGSEIVDWANRHPIIRTLLGPAGRQLGSDGFPTNLPPLPSNTEAAVIMGKRCTIPLFKSMLDKDNDGIVSVGRGKLAGLKGFSVIDADHTFIQMHPDAIRMSTEFLQTGNWPD